MPAEKGRWVLVVLGFWMTFCHGAIYAFSVFRKPLEGIWGISATESLLPFLVFLGCFAFGMAATGGLLERRGPRKIGILGGVFTGIGWILAGLSPNISILTFMYGVIGGAGVGMSYNSAISIGAKWFPDKRGLAIGFILVGIGIAAMFVAPVMKALIAVRGPFWTFTATGVVFLVVLILLASPLRHPPFGWLPQGWTPPIQTRQTIELDRAEAIRTGTYYVIWVCFMIGSGTGLMAIGIAAPYGKEVALVSPAVAALGVSALAAFNGVGRPVFGWITDRLSPRLAAVTAYALVFTTSAALVLGGEGNVVLYFIAFSILGLCMGGWLAIAPTTTAKFFGTKYFGRIYGPMFTAFGVGAIMANLMAGMIRDKTGSYIPVFYPVMAMVAFGAILAFLWLKPMRTTHR